MARFGSWVIVEPKFVKNTKVESLISRSLGGTLKLTTRGRVGFYFSVQTSFDHNLAIPKHAIPNQNILSRFFFTFDQKMGQKVLKMGFKCLGLVWYVLVWLDCDQNWSELKNRIQTAFYSKFQSSFQTPGN